MKKKIYRRRNERFAFLRMHLRRATDTTLHYLKIALSWIVIGGALWAAGAIGALIASTPNATAAENIATSTPKEATAPILQRIADAESGTNCKPGTGKQFKANGEIVTNQNTNGTVDVGKYQINLSADHIKEMARLGLNPLTLEGNTSYAKYLYANRGTGPWSSSQRCWSR